MKSAKPNQLFVVGLGSVLFTKLLLRPFRLYANTSLKMDLLTLYQQSKSNKDYAMFVATVTTGFERVSLSEMKEKLSDSLNACKDRGKVFFSTSSERIGDLLNMRSVDNLYMLTNYGKYPEILEDKETALGFLQQLACNTEWQQAMSVWKKVSSFEGNCFPSEEAYMKALEEEKMIKKRLWENLAENNLHDNMHLHTQFCDTCQRGDPDECEYLKQIKGNFDLKEKTYKSETRKLYKKSDMRCSGDKVLKYRVTCNRTGTHSFASQEAAYHVGGRLQDMYHWVVDLVHYDFEIAVNIKNDEVYIGVALTKESLHKRNITHFGPTTLRATICYNLLRLAEPLPGDVVVDPLCGGGSIPIEGALAFPATFHLCGDIHSKAVARSFANIQALNNRQVSFVDLISWNAKALPIRDSSVDVLITDLPFGKRSGSKFNNQSLYEGALWEFARILRPAGRAVCLTWDKKTFLRNVTKFGTFWTLLKTLTVNIGGLDAAAYLLKRKDQTVAGNFVLSGRKNKKKKEM